MPASLHANGAFRVIFRAIFFALAAALVLGGCVHRIEIRQGDARIAQNAEKLIAGMSQTEVEELLGEPQTQSPFRDGKWIYLYKIRESGFFGKTGQFVLKINFEGNRVRDFEVFEQGEFPEPEVVEAVEDAEDAEEAEDSEEAEEDEESEDADDSEGESGDAVFHFAPEKDAA